MSTLNMSDSDSDSDTGTDTASKAKPTVTLSQQSNKHRSHSVTQFRFKHVRHEWVIKDFAKLAFFAEGQTQFLFSDQFVVQVVDKTDLEGDGTVKLGFFIYLDWNEGAEATPEARKDIGVFVTSEDSYDAQASVTFHVRQPNGSKWSATGRKVRYLTESTVGFASAFSKDHLKDPDYCVNGSSLTDETGALTIVLDMDILCPHFEQHGPSPLNYSNPSERSVGSLLWDQRLFADAELTCGEEDSSVRCHRAVLAASSDVFSAMFSNDATTEGRTGKVTISDMTPDMLEAFVRLLYYGSDDYLVPDLVSMHSVDDLKILLTAADKYNVDWLRCACQAALSRSVDATNAIGVLELATLLRLDALRQYVMDFAAANRLRIMQSSEWKEAACSSCLANEILVHIKDT